ncbi:hypothetical protein GHU05_07060 [Fructobacillus tropaeoli]|uniref:hypothetical protein n=1 Tax=Fructobacillus tropaeoli TaxID=709323 RepID=UPI00145617B1|nr:hypothetical protein [Fructobacillus tropaeoli]NLS38679.1 hypothetical protein [Fructobacillus tropaeoli]
MKSYLVKSNVTNGFLEKIKPMVVHADDSKMAIIKYLKKAKIDGFDMIELEISADKIEVMND